MQMKERFLKLVVFMMVIVFVLMIITPVSAQGTIDDARKSVVRIIALEPG